MTPRIALLAAVAALACVGAALANPSVPDGYTALLNVTVYSQGAPNGDTCVHGCGWRGGVAQV